MRLQNFGILWVLAAIMIVGPANAADTGNVMEVWPKDSPELTGVDPHRVRVTATSGLYLGLQ